MAATNFVIDEEVFMKLYKQSEEIHGNLSIIKDFCEYYENIDEFYKIIPLIKYTHKTSDEMFCKFIRIENSDNED